jgi:cyclophilin family peptidyl-prolyl cis-trans isomerase
LVVQPLLQPLRAVLDKRNPARPLAVFPPEAPGTTRAFSGYRTYVDKLVVIETERGPMRFRLRPDCAPNTAFTFRHLAEGGFFDGTDFFRTVPVGSAVGKGFVVQGGDPTLTEPYDGGPGFDLALEPSTLLHDYGVLSMARDTEPDTAGSQFFICLSREETARLDGQYAAFGQMVWPPAATNANKTGEQPGQLLGQQAGLGPVEVLTTIANSPLLPGKKDRPVKPIRINSMRLIDAAPYGEGDKVVTLDGNKPGVR